MATTTRCNSRRQSTIVRRQPGTSFSAHEPRLTWLAEPVDQYLRNFQWNKVKYRADKPIADLIDSLQKVRPRSAP